MSLEWHYVKQLERARFPFLEEDSAQLGLRVRRAVMGHDEV